MWLTIPTALCAPYPWGLVALWQNRRCGSSSYKKYIYIFNIFVILDRHYIYFNISRISCLYSYSIKNNTLDYNNIGYEKKLEGSSAV